MQSRAEINYAKALPLPYYTFMHKSPVPNPESERKKILREIKRHPMRGKVLCDTRTRPLPSPRGNSDREMCVLVER